MACDLYFRKSQANNVIPERFERSTHSLEGCCSIQLSYGTSVSEHKISAFIPNLQKNIKVAVN